MKISRNRFYLMERHSSAIPVWHECGMHKDTLICLDAHLDAEWIEDSSLSTILKAKSNDDLKCLEREDPLSPNGCFDISNFLYVAIKREMIRQIFWVPSPYFPFHSADRAVTEVRRILTNLIRFSEQEFEEIFFNDGCVRARIYGLPITVCPLNVLSDIDEEILLDIDLDFFIDIKSQQPLISPIYVGRFIRKTQLRVKCATLSLSVCDGFVPERYRYYAEALVEILTTDDGNVSDLHRVLLTADKLLDEGESELSIYLVERLGKIAASSGSAQFFLSIAYAKKGRQDMAAAYRNRSALIDKRYLPLPFAKGLYYHISGQVCSSQKIDELKVEMTRNHSKDGRVNVLLGFLYTDAGCINAAIEAHEKAFSQGFWQKEVLENLGYLLLETDQEVKASEILHFGRRLYPHNYRINFLLAIMAVKAGRLLLALEYLRVVVAVKPTDSHAYLYLAAAYDRLGMTSSRDKAIAKFVRYTHRHRKVND
jgi:tetratricopeptide (TPR) repeat protein